MLHSLIRLAIVGLGIANIIGSYYAFAGRANYMYYFANTGNDSNECLSPATACQTIVKLNSISYNGGDTILLNGGDTFTDAIVTMRGPSTGGTQNVFNTSLSSPQLTINSYGTGNANIRAGVVSSVTAGVVINNLFNVIVENLNVSAVSGSAANADIGIYIRGNDPSVTYGGIVVQNCSVTGFAQNIFVNSLTSAGWNGVQILNNHVYGTNNNEKNGILIGNAGTYASILYHNITISGNLVEDLPGISGECCTGDDILLIQTDGGLSEFNVTRNSGRNNTGCGGMGGNWTFVSLNVLFQFNESYGHGPTTFTAGCDWDGFDFDIGVSNSTYQYNYAHNNWGSGFLLYVGNGSNPWGGNTIRYNIAENTAQTTAANFFGSCVSTAGGSMAGLSAKVYNNTCYMTTGSFGIWNINIPTTVDASLIIANNIMYAAGSAGDLRTVGTSTAPTLKSNDYYNAGGGNTVSWKGVNYATYTAFETATTADPTGTGANPNLASPGNGGARANVGGGPRPCPSAYQLNAGSPMIGAGADLALTFGINPGAQDYYGNAIPHSVGTGWNIGADGGHH